MLGGGWHFSNLIFSRFIIFTFRNYFTLCKSGLCIWRKIIFSCHHNFMEKKKKNSKVSRNEPVCMCEEVWLGWIRRVVCARLEGTVWNTLKGGGGWNKKEGKGNRNFGMLGHRVGALKRGDWTLLRTLMFCVKRGYHRDVIINKCRGFYNLKTTKDKSVIWTPV